MKRKIDPLQIALGAALALLIVGGVAMLGGKTQSDSTPAAAQSAAQSEAAEANAGQEAEASDRRGEQERLLLSLAKRDPADPAAKGALDAPVVIIEWADFRCPFCSAFSEQTLPKLQKYIDSGQVRFEFRDLAIFGDDSVYAAAAARAAGKQGKHFEFMTEIFLRLPNQGHPPVDRDLVMKIATDIGVPDLEQFASDIDSRDFEEAVRAESNEAQQLGLNSVPAFTIGGQYVAGAQPLEIFEKVIDQELAKANR